VQDVTENQQSLDSARQALAQVEASHDPWDKSVGHALRNFAAILCSANQHLEAEPLLERALAILDDSTFDSRLDSGRVMCELACVYQQLNKLKKAEKLYRMSLLRLSDRVQILDSTALMAAHSLATLYEKREAYDQAEGLLNTVLKIKEKSLGQDDAELSNTLLQLAGVLKLQHRIDECRQCYDRALKVRKTAK